MSRQDRKEQIAQYKQNPPKAGVYWIVNQVTGKYMLGYTMDIKGMQNRFAFAQKYQSYGALPGKLWDDIAVYGGENFVLEVLETLEIKPEMTKNDINDELLLLEKIWLDKLDSQLAY